MANEQDMKEFRAYSQQYQMMLIQKQAIEAQKAEMDNTMTELEKAAGKVYFASGAILVETPKKEAAERIKKQKEEAADALAKIKVQEDKVKKKLDELQKKLQGSGKDE